MKFSKIILSFIIFSIEYIKIAKAACGGLYDDLPEPYDKLTDKAFNKMLKSFRRVLKKFHIHNLYLTASDYDQNDIGLKLTEFKFVFENEEKCYLDEDFPTAHRAVGELAVIMPGDSSNALILFRNNRCRCERKIEFPIIIEFEDLKSLFTSRCMVTYDIIENKVGINPVEVIENICQYGETDEPLIFTNLRFIFKIYSKCVNRKRRRYHKFRFPAIPYCKVLGEITEEVTGNTSSDSSYDYSSGSSPTYSNVVFISQKKKYKKKHRDKQREED
ncbi:hypothetical protein DMUE_4075 [Dictyocoela muelleri]|nr:hypothetical protein DMUE_4075 [Dictyocoela muelleri]